MTLFDARCCCTGRSGSAVSPVSLLMSEMRSASPRAKSFRRRGGAAQSFGVRQPPATTVQPGLAVQPALDPAHEQLGPGPRASPQCVPPTTQNPSRPVPQAVAQQMANLDWDAGGKLKRDRRSTSDPRARSAYLDKHEHGNKTKEGPGRAVERGAKKKAPLAEPKPHFHTTAPSKRRRSTATEGMHLVVRQLQGRSPLSAEGARRRSSLPNGHLLLPPHLRLGMDFDTFQKFIVEELSKVGYGTSTIPQLGVAPATSNHVHRSPRADLLAFRKKYPESLFWIEAQYGDRPTGYDLAEAIKMWLRTNNAEGKSVCEVLKERGWTGIGTAEVFLSHVQAESPDETLRAMRNIDKRFGVARKLQYDKSKIWLDYVSLRQLQNDFKPEQIVELIDQTGAVYVFMDGAVTGSSYTRRTFCILETSSAIERQATLMIETPVDGPLREPAYSAWACCAGECLRHPMPDYTIDAAAATARRADDKAKVDKFIEEGPGFALVNQVMERELRRAALMQAWSEPVIWWCCCPCAALACCCDAVLPSLGKFMRTHFL